MPSDNPNTESGRIQIYITRRRGKTNGKRFDREGNPIRFDLKAADIRHLLSEAGITIWDIGSGPQDYCLARDNDLGSYTIGNCRFITNRENHLERLSWKERSEHGYFT